MTVRELFDFIVDPSITDESVESYLDKVRISIYFLSIRTTQMITNTHN